MATSGSPSTMVTGSAASHRWGSSPSSPSPASETPPVSRPGPDGNMWFTEAGSVNSIGRVTPAGSIAEYPIPTADSDPAGITVGPDMSIWFTELSSNKVGRLSNLTGGGNLNSSTGSAVVTPVVGMPCTTDTDCVGSGKACGGDVCSSKLHACVLASSGDPRNMHLGCEVLVRERGRDL